MKKEDLKVWCILIPTLKAEDCRNKHFRTRHHKVWDKYVRGLTGGLTIFAPSKGQWVNDDDELVEEKILPVNVACTDAQINKIIQFTISHYKQDAIMCYKVSEEVYIFHKDDKK